MMVFPKASETIITDINSAISNSIGSVYLFMGLAIFCFVLYIAFGKYGNVTLGKASDKPEFNNFTWAAMLFCAGIGSDILYWGVIEWAFYYKCHLMAQNQCQMKHFNMRHSMVCSTGALLHGLSMYYQHYQSVILCSLRNNRFIKLVKLVDLF